MGTEEKETLATRDGEERIMMRSKREHERGRDFRNHNTEKRVSARHCEEEKGGEISRGTAKRDMNLNGKVKRTHRHLRSEYDKEEHEEAQGKKKRDSARTSSASFRLYHHDIGFL